MELGILLSVIGVSIGILSLIPVIFDIGKYYRIIKIKFSKDSLIIEDARVTFDIRSISEIHIYLTTKYKIIKNDPELILPFTNRFGNVSNIIFFADNVKIIPEIAKQNDVVICKYKITNKVIGDTIIIDSICKMDADPSLINKKNDGLAFWLDYYKCRYLKMLIIYPKNFIPYNISFSIRPPDFSETYEIKEKFGSIKSSFLFDKNRRAVEWLVEYPKFNKAYRIGWSWEHNSKILPNKRRYPTA